MEGASVWFTNVKKVSLELISNFIAYLPSLIGAMLLLVAGWLLARLLRTGAVRISDGINRLLDTVIPTGHLANFRLSKTSTRLIGNATYWLVIFFSLTVASDVAGLETFSSLLEGVSGYLPHLLGGGLIILVGYLISAAIRDVVSTTATSMGVEQGELIGATAQWATFLTAVIVGIEQVGIDVTFLIIVIAIVVGALLGGMALAFGLGAKPLVTNLIGAHYLQRKYAPGQFLQIAQIEGQVLEITSSGIVLETGAGRSTLPGNVYFSDLITVTGGGQTDE